MKTTKNIILLTILGLFSCKNENSYKPFQPATLEYINSIKYDCISVDSLKVTTNPFKSVWELNYYDSIYNSWEDKCREKKNLLNCFDSIFNLRENEEIYGVLKSSIVRYDSINNIRAIVYENNKYDEMESGYWIALSKDKGNNWKYYYTGITKANFYYFKPNSSVALFVNDSIIQIESAIVRKTEEMILPIGSPTYELIKDGLIVSLHLNKLCLDSDNDGLTDIEEKKTLTNPFNADSDGDGILDGQDNNPRFKDIDSDFSTLIRFLLDGDFIPSDSLFLPFNDSTKSEQTRLIEKQVYLIVSDDLRVINLSRTKNTYIFINNIEFGNYMKTTAVSLNRIGINIKRVGIFTKKYKITINEFSSTTEYLVTKKNSGWKIELKMSVMS